MLQGLAICAVCGDRMTVRYHVYRDGRVPDYVCQRRPICQTISGKSIDDAVGKLLVETVSPVALEVALAVQQELEQRAAEVDRLRAQEVEQARYAAELARRRYMQVDPDNRLVADALEANWNEKLRAVAAAQGHYEARRKADRLALDEQQRVKILQLATDFPRLWNASTTPDRERKRMVRLLIEDVALFLLRGEQMIDVCVRFKGGVTRTLHIPRPKPVWTFTQTPAEIIAEIDRLLDEHTDGEIAKLLNERGRISGRGLAFNPTTVRNIRITHNLKSRYRRLREQGFIDKHEMAARLGVAVDTLKVWRRKGLIHQGHAYNDRRERLFEPLGEDAPQKCNPNGKCPQSRSDPPDRSERVARGAV